MTSVQLSALWFVTRCPSRKLQGTCYKLFGGKYPRPHGTHANHGYSSRSLTPRIGKSLRFGMLHRNIMMTGPTAKPRKRWIRIDEFVSDVRRIRGHTSETRPSRRHRHMAIVSIHLGFFEVISPPSVIAMIRRQPFIMKGCD